jgi:hypothetical protein
MFLIRRAIRHFRLFFKMQDYCLNISKRGKSWSDDLYFCDNWLSKKPFECDDHKAIRVHQIASGCEQNLFPIKSPKKYFRNFRVFSIFFQEFCSEFSQKILFVKISFTGFLLSLLSKKLEHIFFEIFRNIIFSSLHQNFGKLH